MSDKIEVIEVGDLVVGVSVEEASKLIPDLSIITNKEYSEPIQGKVFRVTRIKTSPFLNDTYCSIEKPDGTHVSDSRNILRFKKI